jgi:death on curing protein
LAKNHCFLDGNKRIAWMAAVEVILREGLEVNATTDEAADLVLRVADNLCSREQVLEWFSADGRLLVYRPSCTTDDRPAQ